jgi:hypothetical protein
VLHLDTVLWFHLQKEIDQFQVKLCPNHRIVCTQQATISIIRPVRISKSVTCY